MPALHRRPWLALTALLLTGTAAVSLSKRALASTSARWAQALRRAAALREEAVRQGDQPYGAVVADAEGRVLVEARSQVVSARDPNAHAERVALKAAQQSLGREDLGGWVLVGSSQACSACQAAAARAGVSQLVWPGGESRPALIEAAARGDVAAMSRAVEEMGAPLNTRDLRGQSALLACVRQGHDEAARWLIRRGADINVQDDIQDSPFLLAGALGRTAMLGEMLLPPTGSPERPNTRLLNRYGGTALIPACHHGHVEAVKLLLRSSRIDVNHVNRLGWTALLEAVILGNGAAAYQEIVKLLLAHRANPNLPDASGVTPLAHARSRGQSEVASLIAAAGGR
jgi:uncharacterized protein